MKFGRTYRITIQISDTESIVIAPPPGEPEKLLTFNFEINRGVLHSANRGHFMLYNLTPTHRLQIFHDRFDNATYRGIIIQAGYENESPLPTIFQGNILDACSYRQGTNWITEINAFDGGFGIANGQVSQTIPVGWTLPQIIKTVLSAIPKVNLGAIGNLDQENSRGITLMGNPWDIANQIATSQNATAFIDNETSNILADDEYITTPSGIPLIDASTGLLDTPRRYDSRIDVKILFEPRLVVGQLVQLRSASLAGLSIDSGNPQNQTPGPLLGVNNGQYKVYGITHQGTISGAVGGEATTTVNLFVGLQRLIATARAA